MRFKLQAFGLLLLSIPGLGQDAFRPQYSKAIEDNSYFIEEAYNQEDRVVQHISNGYYTVNPTKDFLYSFTQEWPFTGQKHQLSYTLGYSWLNSNTVNGLSDFMINYRYQLTGHDDFLTLAPRLSIIIPSGDEEKGLGNGVWGYQFNLPMSKRLSNAIVSHANVGFTLLPGVKMYDSFGEEHKYTLWNMNLGASIIWLASEKFNLMLEGVHYINSSVNTDNKRETDQQSIISPGLRYAIDINNLQIVPGIAIPVTLSEGDIEPGYFFYVSFEHPF